MKGNAKSSRGTAVHPGAVVSRFFVISGAAGVLIGLFEACLLWTTPRVIPLLVPDVGYVIWFLAPLIDMTLFGLLGLLLGWLAARKPSRNKTAVLVAVDAAACVMFIALRLQWLHERVFLEPLAFFEVAAVPAFWFILGFLVSLVLISTMWGQIVRHTEHRLYRLLKVFAWGLAAVAVAATVGIGVFVTRPTFSGTHAQAASPSSGAPNIIFMTLDTVRADHLSAYGYSRLTTPNLDRFARTGVLFENAIAATSWTLASHASMFTGLLPQQHGADWASPLALSPWTLAEILRLRGYDTAGFTANLLYLQKGWGIAQGFEDYEDNSVSFQHNLADMLLGTGIIQPFYQRFDHFDNFDRENAQQLNRRIFRWFRHRPQRPFFVFVNYFDTHNPYVPPPPYTDRFGRASMDLTRRFFGGLSGDRDSNLINAKERDFLIDAYDNCLAYLDNQVGQLLEFLRHSPGWENTIIIITSDHGEEFGLHGSYDHGRNLYRGVLHVPLIIAGPGIPQGSRVSHLVGTRQLFSTVLDLAGHGNTPFSRYGLARFWKPDYKTTPFDDDVVSELVPIADLSARHPMISVTTPQWQYIKHRSGRQELYHWTVDPHEQDNLAALPAQQATLERLQSRLLGLVSDATGPWRGIAYLRALGKMPGTTRLNLLHPHPLVPGVGGNRFRIGIAQTYFKFQPLTRARPRGRSGAR